MDPATPDYEAMSARLDRSRELDLRTAGASTTGVWGTLPEDDRRALHRVWQRRRQQQKPKRSGSRRNAMTVNLSPTQVIAILGVRR